MSAAPREKRAQAVARHVEGGLPGFVELRHDLHRHPELAFEERRTAAPQRDL